MKKEFINLDFVMVAGRKIKFISIMLSNQIIEPDKNTTKQIVMRCMTDNSRPSRQIQFYFIKFCFIKNVKMDTGHNILGCFKDNNCALLCFTFTVAVTNNL